MSRRDEEKTCYCHDCKKHYHPLGIMSHRAGHIRRGEACTITYTHGNTTRHSPKGKHPA